MSGPTSAEIDRSVGPRGSLFARRLRGLATNWSADEVEAVVRALRFQARRLQLDALSIDDLAWLARDAEAAKRVLEDRGAMLVLVARGVWGTGGIALAALLAAAPWRWKLIGVTVLAASALGGARLHLAGRQLRRAAEEIGALIAEIDAAIGRARGTRAHYRTAVSGEEERVELLVEASQHPALESRKERGR